MLGLFQCGTAAVMQAVTNGIIVEQPIAAAGLTIPIRKVGLW